MRRSFPLRKPVLFLLFLTLLGLQVAAQHNKANHWYFSNYAGIDFNAQPPQPDLDGRVEAFARGSSVMSDDNGNLLFYTDGHQVWNRKHELMPGGAALLPAGTSGSLKLTTVIVPKPSAHGIYYIFTAHPFYNPIDHGLFYTIVDMSLDNGYGDVAQSSEVLYKPVTGHLTVAQHANGFDFWLIAPENNSTDYLAFEVTNVGVSNNPVRSTGPLAHNWNVEQMKVAPDGSKVALTNGRFLELSDFNATTGKLTNFSLLRGTPSYDVLRGVEFSANSSVVYAASLYEGIYQFDLSKNTSFEIAGSLHKIRAGQENVVEDLQLAPDGKIYTAKGGGQAIGAAYLGVIHNPNALGDEAGYAEAGYYLGGAYVSLRLPTFVTAYLAEPASISYTNLCFGEVTTLKASGIGSRDAVAWDFGDPASGAGNVSSDLSPTHTFSAPGTYTVSLQVFLENQVKNYEQEVTIHEMPRASLGDDIRTCSGETVVLDAGVHASYTWSTGATTRNIAVSASGTYWVDVSNGFCTSRDIIQVEFVAQPVLELGPDLSLCDDTPVTLSVGEANKAYNIRWSTGATSPTITVHKTGDYWVEVTNDMCTARDGVAIRYHTLLDLAVVASKDTLSYDEVLQLGATGENLVAWIWDFGDGSVSESSSPSHTYATAGEYTLTLTATNQNGCRASASKRVMVAPYLFIPNIFTPNNDGKNDAFQVVYNGKGLFEVYVYNRWGKEVYRASSKDFAWDGNGATDGVYHYLIKTERDTYRGTVTLVK